MQQTDDFQQKKTVSQSRCTKSWINKVLKYQTVAGLLSMLEATVIPLVGEKIFMNSGQLIAQAAKHCKA